VFSKVLFFDDFSEYSRVSLESIRSVPGIKELSVIHIIDAEEETPKKNGTDNSIVEVLKERAKIIEEKGIKVNTLVDYGPASEKILAAAEQQGVSLIAVGARGKSLIRDIVLGSVSSNIIRYGKRSALIVRLKNVEAGNVLSYEPLKENIFRKIIFATDFSRYASNAFDCLLGNIKGMGTEEVILTHILNKGESAPRIGLAHIESENILKGKAMRVKELGVKSKVAVRSGAPVAEINKLAGEEQATCIVVGARGKGYLQEVLLGSVAEDLVRNSNLSVLVIKVDCGQCKKG